jgi:hypothetical protein
MVVQMTNIWQVTTMSINGPCHRYVAFVLYRIEANFRMCGPDTTYINTCHKYEFCMSNMHHTCDFQDACHAAPIHNVSAMRVVPKKYRHKLQ